jgi:MoxR-like ATPase
VQRPTISTIGDLRASGHERRGVKEEIRQNLLARLRAGQDPFPGIIGFGQTVLPHLERALIAGHDIILLGERGQGKTRLIRTLGGLLDEWTPVVDGCEINDHPYAPVCQRCRRLAAEFGDQLPVAWRHASERYGEKLATPDTSIGDLIGDIDPVKVAEGRTLGDPETIHYGLVPRTNRGIFSLNELPDLAERIQVSLLNVLEERDIGVRGYALRLPLDLLLVASANPEDYTSRGRIITPLKDRFGAEIRTHYPRTLDDELALIEQEAELPSSAEIPEPHRGDRPVHPAGARLAGGGQPLRGVRPVRDRRRRERGRLGRPAGGADVTGIGRRRRAGSGGPGVRRGPGRPHPPRQGRVRGQRGGPGGRAAGGGAQARHRRHLPGSPGQRRPVRPAGSFR